MRANDLTNTTQISKPLPKKEHTITDYDRAVMEGGHSLEQPAKRSSALREAVADTDAPRISIGGNQLAKDWIKRVHSLYPSTFQSNHVMMWGEGDDQELAMFELTPSFSRRGAVEVKWFQAYPLRKGVGSKAMRELQKLAHEDGIALTLYPWDKGQVSQAKLIKFYKSHGFKPTVKGGKNMYWEPPVQEASLATMRDYFAGDKNARDPYEITKQRLYFDKEAKPTGNVKRKEFRSEWEFQQWLKQNKLKLLSKPGVTEGLEKFSPEDVKIAIDFNSKDPVVGLGKIWEIVQDSKIRFNLSNGHKDALNKLLSKPIVYKEDWDMLKKQMKTEMVGKQGVAEGLEDKVVFQGHTIGHIETDSDGDPVGIVYSNNPQSKRPFEIFGYEDVNQLKQEMISQWNKRVPKGVAEGSYDDDDTLMSEKLHDLLQQGMDYKQAVNLVAKTYNTYPEYVVGTYNRWGNHNHDPYDDFGEQGVAEGLNEFAPDGFNGGDDDEGFSPEIAKMAQEDGFTKGAGLADGATLERAMAINHWHSTHGGMYKQYFAKGFKAGRMDKIRHNNKQYNLNLKLMKDGSIRHGEQGVAEGAPIVVAQAPIHIRNPKKSPQPYRNQGDIVPDTKPPSTEKRGVKGRAGQRPMPKYDESITEDQGWIGNPAKWKEAVLQAHGPDVVFKNYSHPGQPGKRSVHAWDANNKIVGVYQRHNKMGMVQPNMQDVAEGWKDALSNLAIAGAIGAAGAGGLAASDAYHKWQAGSNTPASTSAKQVQEPVAKSAIAQGVQQAQDAKKGIAKTSQPVPKKVNVQPITANPLEGVLLKVAKSAGLAGVELAAFMAQVAHESHDFQSMVEYGGRLDFRKYDPKFAPKKAKALGNTKVGDGAKYKGRGFIQLTGRHNYKKAGEELGLPLEKHPEMVSDPKIAAQVAVWFWKHRVQPNVNNFNDVQAVTKMINPGMRGLADRVANFKEYIGN